MEEKGIRRKHLKWRMLKNIFLILAVSMVISTAVGYWYFGNVVRKQRISDESSRLQQLSSQLMFMTEDIEQFARSILIDEELQRLLEEDVSGNEFLTQSRYDKVTKRLVFYGSLRPCIAGSILQMEDGTSYGSSYNAIDTKYIGEKLQKYKITDHDGSRYAYSEPYYDTAGQDGNLLICYQVPMFDKYHFGKKKGTLYIELKLDYFLNQVRSYAEPEDYVCLTGNKGNILYEQDSDGKLSRCLKQENREEDGIYQTPGGYLICNFIDGPGWRLYTLITNKYLWQRSRFVLVFFLLSFLCSVGLILIFISRRVETVIRPITELSGQMERTAYGKFDMIETVHTGDEIETLYECFNHMLSQLKKGEEERIQYERQKRDMEYDITLSQINPHYLYNVLNTVVYLAAAGKNKDVVKIVHSLIYTLHDTLNIGEGSVETTIEKELLLTHCYLDIQKYRYPDIFTVDVQCGEELKKCRVPKTIIQPLVENAILHGILPAEREGKIGVHISECDGKLLILVEDDGEGIGQEELERFREGKEIVAEKSGRKHVGVSNVRDRIRYLYGEPYGMEIKRKENGGTKVFLWLPLQRMEEEQKLKTDVEKEDGQ